MKARICLVCFYFGFLLNLFPDVIVEKIATIPEIQKERGAIGGPELMSVDEAGMNIKIPYRMRSEKSISIHLNDDNTYTLYDDSFENADGEYAYELGQWFIRASSLFVAIDGNEKEIKDISGVKGGLSFILKSDDKVNYYLFYVSDDGSPRALDTQGKRYAYKEVIGLLERLDPEKFQESLERAKALSLYNAFINGTVLVWGQTYYATAERLSSYWKKTIVPHGALPIQYDLQGNAYQLYLYWGNSWQGRPPEMELWITGPDGKRLELINVRPYSEIYSGDDIYYKTSCYVGWGGNVYFFAASEGYTEVFRIRRTWGEPDMYALAVNGCTGDAYGEYVKQVLAEMESGSLRLLRNYLFALYGCPFKSPDLEQHFNRQVWYTAVPGLESSDIQLSPNRQGLLELIQAEELRRSKGQSAP
jgi:hypothetical protein